MQSTILLYECPPLRARMTSQQCDANRTRAASPCARRRLHKSRDEDARPERKECAQCQGVLWWAKHTGRGPKTLCSTAVQRGIAEKEALRKRLAGVPLLLSRRAEFPEEIARAI